MRKAFTIVQCRIPLSRRRELMTTTRKQVRRSFLRAKLCGSFIANKALENGFESFAFLG